MFKIGDIVMSKRTWGAGLTDTRGNTLSVPIRAGDTYIVEALDGVNDNGEQCIRLKGVEIRFRCGHFTYVNRLTAVRSLSLTLASHICLT